MLLGIKRIYEKASMTDGKRILVDRLWPRGVRKSTSNVDSWLKEIAPSESLRKWFGHNPEKWPAFRKRYEAELKRNRAFEALVEQVKKEDVTLIYAAKDEKHNNAAALAEVLKMRMPRRREMEDHIRPRDPGVGMTEERIRMLEEQHGLSNAP